jgi:glucose/arabinose dehydrogenase
MTRLTLLWTFLIAATAIAARADEADRKSLAAGLKNPESVAIDVAGRVFVSVIGEFDTAGDGSIVVLDGDKFTPHVEELDDPKGLVAFNGSLFVADRQQVWQIDEQGNKRLFAPANAFPTTPKFLNDLAVDPESGTLYVSDSGDLMGGGGAVYRISPKGLVDVVVNKDSFPELHTPNGLALDGASHLLLGDFGSGTLYRVKLATRTVEKLADGLGSIDGLCWDRFGRLFISAWKEGEVFVIGRPGGKPEKLATGFKAAADICLDPTTKRILVPDMFDGSLQSIAAVVPGAPVLDAPLPLTTEVAFKGLEWDGWSPESDAGVVVPLRPIVLTHAGDGSKRTFVATQHGVIHSIAPKAKKSQVFMDISERVRYQDMTNEEGLLGLAFHPKFKENGEFFVFYTIRSDPNRYINVVSRFRTKSDDPSRGDPASEEELMRFEHPFWNHDGGTLAFGPDGYLYIALGDGGFANDLYNYAQNLSEPLGSILRIDVDSKSGDKPYAVPKDNPFVDKPDVAPEIWAYGLRNVWRFSFDRETGACWAGEVGQNLYEEIDILTAGGNYGWNIREGLHPFGAAGVGPRDDLIDPIWEYHHDTGKSITGGHVYRGKRLPELKGAYLYADYVTGIVWALRYDEKAGRVVANQEIPGPKIPVLSFGEDEDGEVYALVASPTGEGILRFSQAKAKTAGGQ